MSHSTKTEWKDRQCMDLEEFRNRDSLARQIKVLSDMLTKLLGRDSIDQSMEQMGLEEKVMALHKLVFQNDKEKQSVGKPDNVEEINHMVDEIEEGLANMAARRTVENNLEKKVIDLMEKRQHQYMNELKLQIMKKSSGPENANTLKKYAELEKLEYKKLAKQGFELMRPASTHEIVGQDRAVKALISKLATPYPQHVLIYGPPGVGKTTAARLVLEMAKKMPHTPFPEDAAFVEVDGTTLRWDPREITNPLLGSVHDPIYQGSKRDLADSGIPEPKTGLVTEAHCGVLFIDEIGELDFFLQNKLLKVMEDKRVHFDSAYYDPDDENTPKYIKKLFDEGAPADFILIGATTRHPSEINPALRSRCAEVFFEPLAPDCVQEIVCNAAKRIDASLEHGVDEDISLYTTEGRKAINLLMDAYGMALFRNGDKEASRITITKADLNEVVQISRIAASSKKHGRHKGKTGCIYGLGVNGFLGSAIEFEAVAFPAGKEGRGTVRFNDTAGSMAKDAVFNAATVIRKLTGEDISGYDIHVNAIGGGKIDGPSAGAAMVLLILSAMKEIPVWQDTAVTGEISLQGRVKPVGGVFEKVNGAKQAGMKKVLIPKENLKDVPPYISGIEVIPVETIEEAMEQIFVTPFTPGC